ncbi:sigma-70 family RNA polymerase sigma factor [Clostridium sp. MCC353]|uniref:RNA polymerase sigma factor n=1 Tax=Clostridium sp. MCC353 TaxID=2592646 RepID=UPI001C00FEA7|nr:RNA polymerase sigma factor [Clostridium sp. MCC353]MBT9778292.1 sigma-70 family RNA polymerase sigma factor [Clostridium sp. MCC353]
MKLHFERIYQEQKNSVYGYLYYMTKNQQTAEDLSQETFLKVYLGMKKFKGECSEKTWCLTIARNTFLSFARKKKPELLVEECPEQMDSHENIPEERVIEEENKREIAAAFSALNADDRTILLLRDYERLSYAEIAGIMGISEAVTKVRIYRARERYRKIYGACPSVSGKSEVK